MTATNFALLLAGLVLAAVFFAWRRHIAVEMVQARERKQYYRTVFANAGVGILRLDGVGIITEANEAFLEFIGYSFEELKNTSVFNLVHPEERDGMQARAIVTITGEAQGYRAERRYVRKDGSIRWADVRTCAIRHTDGSFLAFISVIVDITERKEAELIFREGQEKMLEITENLSAAVFQLHRSPDGTRHFTYLNEEIQRICGLSRLRLLQNAGDFFSCIEPEDAPLVEQGLENAGRKLEKWSCDFRLRHPEGGIHWLFGKAVPRKASDGGIVWNGYFNDVTERRVLDHKFRAIFDSSFDAYFLIDTKARAVDCNVTAIKAFKASGRDEILTLGPMCYSPEQQPDGKRSFDKFQTLITEALADGHSKCEWLFRVHNAPMPSDLTLIRLDVGQLPTILVVVHDLTERKKAEAEIVESRNLLRGVIDNSMAVICAKDGEGRYLLVNRRWGEILEHAEADVIGKTDTEIFPPDQAQDYRRNDVQVMQTLKPLTIEEHAVIDGERRTFLAVKFPIIDRDGQASAVCGISTDITELKRIHEDLHEARQQADAANRAKSQFLANMSHEIRTPMNAIMGFVYLAQQSDPPNRIRDYLQKIQGAAKGLLGIINEILDFSKIEVGKLTLEHIEFDLEQVIDNVSGMITLRAQEKGLELLLAIDPGVPRNLIGDPLRLEQVLVNLTSNAVKFTESGEVVMNIRLLSQTGGKDGEAPCATLEIKVRDTGVGLTPDQMTGLFKPFTQADGSTTRKYGGTGLGLSICKRLVEMMRGTIGVSSESGRGSMFTFTAEFGVAAATVPCLPSPDLRNLKVLVVDDHAASRDYLSNVLASLSFDVIEARDGQEALNILERPIEGSRIELILMDWQMPGLDGIETTRRIQALRGPDRTPTIIMVTAFGRDKAMAHAGDVPIDEFLVKPVTPSTLFDSVMRVFKKEHPKRRPEAGVEVGPDLQKLVGKRVLLVEDNDLNQEVAVTMLTRVGMAVRTAENGLVALSCLEAEPFDLVLMDCQMPEMDGYECTREIRRREAFSRLPVIAMTANAVSGDRERCLEAGMNDHVPKPIDPVHLFRVLVQWSSSNALGEGPMVPAGEQPSHPPKPFVKKIPMGEQGASEEVSQNAVFPKKSSDRETLGKSPVLSASSVAGTTPRVMFPAPSSASEDDLSDLRKMKNIDFGPALARLGGDVELFRKLLGKFRRRNLDFGEQVGRAMSRGQWLEAKRLAHTLKGVAATLGVKRLPELAAELERRCADQQQMEAMPALIAVQAFLVDLLSEIEALPTDDVAAFPSTGEDTSEKRVTVGQLSPLPGTSSDTQTLRGDTNVTNIRIPVQNGDNSGIPIDESKQIQTFASASTSPSPSAEAVAEIILLVQELLCCLRADDAEAGTVFETIRERLRNSSNFAGDLKNLESSIEAYAYDEAIPFVESILKRLQER
ncbi:MAG: PAS domain S-box protein [Candidatus Ozemobacteraceae bacterium]